MKYGIRFSPAALCDMEDVWAGVFAASKEEETADQYVQDFVDAIARKGEYPQSGIPLTYRGLFTGVYSVNFKAYKAFYRMKDDCIEVARVIMAKRDYMYILFGENP